MRNPLNALSAHEPAAGEPTIPSPTVPGSGEPILHGVELGRRDREAPERWLFRGLTLQLFSGEIVSLKGSTGSGKTLLLRSLAALDPLDAGELELLGRPFPEWRTPRWRSTAVYLHQAPPLPPGTVAAALSEPFGYDVHAGRTFPEERAADLLRRLGRGEAFLGQRTEELSGGERQVTALVRTLLLHPPVLLLDEPTAAMDPETTAHAEELLRTWLEPDRAALWVTHDAEQARRVADRGLRMAAGWLEPSGRSTDRSGATGRGGAG